MAKKRGNNEGSVSKRSSGSWRAQIVIEGKRINFGAKTKNECMVWLNSMLDQAHQGMDVYGGQTTLEDFLMQWLESAKTVIRPKPAVQYEHIVHAKIIPYLGKIKLKDLHQDRIDRFYLDLQKNGSGVRTVRLTHSILHRALEKAVRSGLLVRNPAHGANLPRMVQTEMNVFDEGQVTHFLTAAHGTRNEALYHLAVTTGMRQGELFGLKWSDLFWTSGTLHVKRQIQHIPHQGWVFGEPKTRAGRRTIKLGEATQLVLQKHLERQRLAIAVAGKRWQHHELIFPTSVGTPMNPSNLHVDFYRLLEQAGLPRIRFHDLRHTAASIMLNHNIPVIVASKVLGHSKPSVTLDIYGHLYHEMQDEVARLMDELVTPIQVEIPQKSPIIE